MQKARIRAQKIAGRFNARAVDIKISYFYPIVSEPERNDREEMYGVSDDERVNLKRKCSIQVDIYAVQELDTATLKSLKKAVYFSGPLSAAKRRGLTRSTRISSTPGWVLMEGFGQWAAYACASAGD